MSNKFKQQASQQQQRVAVPQVNLETVKASDPVPAMPERNAASEAEHPIVAAPAVKQEVTSTEKPKLTIVNTEEDKVNRGFFMYPSRHKQVTKDLVYLEDRKPHEIIEDALEEYVVKHYGKEFRRIAQSA